jgi:hypothetical protein
MSRRRGTRGCGDGFGVNLGVRALGGRAGGLRGAGGGRAVAGQGHAAVAGAAHEPADEGAQLEEAAEGVRIPGGVQVLGEGGGVGEEPVLAQGAQRAAGGLRARDGGEEGQEQELEGGRNPGVQDRPRPGARCVGVARCGGLVGHHRQNSHRQGRWNRKKFALNGNLLFDGKMRRRREGVARPGGFEPVTDSLESCIIYVSFQ